jgi:type I restriction enzyme M protein
MIWEVHEILRGKADEFQIYLYITSLLGLKRHYDIHQGVEGSWKKLYYTVSDLGTTLNRAFQDIDDFYLSKEGLAEVLDFNKDQLQDVRTRDLNLRKVIECIGKFSFSDPEFQSSEKMMKICQNINDIFLERYSALFGHALPGSMVSLITSLLDVQEGEQVYDPFCNKGLALIRLAAQHLDSKKKIGLYGQIDDLKNLVRYNLNTFLVGVSHIEIKVGDVIRDPAFVEFNRMKKFNKIVASVPIGVRNWGYEYAQKDPYYRFSWVGGENITSNMKGEYAYLLHCIASFADQGMLVAVVPQGVLFWERTVKNIREQMVVSDMIEAVIQLPPKMFYGTSGPVSILIMKDKKSEERKNEVLFVDASKHFKEGRFRNTLRDEDIKNIITTCHDFQSIDGFSTVKTISEISQNGYNLSVDRYFPKEDVWKPGNNIEDSIDRLNHIRKERENVYTEMQEVIKELLILQRT